MPSPTASAIPHHTPLSTNRPVSSHVGTEGQFAFCSLRWNTWAWNYYKAKLKAGKGHAESLRCLACIWLRILYAMWRDRAPYHPLRFLTVSHQTDAPQDTIPA